MAKRIIAVVPSLDGTETLNALRRHFDPAAAIVPPHLTLVFPFESQLMASEIRAHIEDSVHGMGAFPIQLSSVTGSEGEYLFLNVKRGNDSLIELHDRLYSGRLSSYLSPEHTFTPHLTVGRLSNPGEFHEALDVATKANLTFDTVVSAISVFVVRPVGPLEVESQVMLD
jgi:2'-5' RNA ligase